MTERTYALSPDCGEKFYNQADYCIGTGRMGLALHKEYYDQLKLVQEHIGFSHIRGHGLFCDDMAIYQEYKNAQGETVTEYNFTYLDRVLDSYQELGLRPFLELGFMPEKMASGDQTVFYWKGNTTPPKDYAQWRALVQALLRHLLERYGQDALAWPLEVWNEPNLPGFWKGADKEEYFRLFSETIAAVKEVDSRFTVGGPAICGVKDVEWMQDFMEYCHQNSLPLDFVTRHFYTFDDPEFVGRYSYGGLRDPEISLEELRRSREIIDSYPEYKGLPMHITEFNTSYSPDSPVHDTTRNAAYIARLLACLGEMNESYSYWTFGDVFEEKGVPFTPFHGGFGLGVVGAVGLAVQGHAVEHLAGQAEALGRRGEIAIIGPLMRGLVAVGQGPGTFAFGRDLGVDPGRQDHGQGRWPAAGDGDVGLLAAGRVVQGPPPGVRLEIADGSGVHGCSSSLLFFWSWVLLVKK